MGRWEHSYIEVVIMVLNMDLKLLILKHSVSRRLVEAKVEAKVKVEQVNQLWLLILLLELQVLVRQMLGRQLPSHRHMRRII